MARINKIDLDQINRQLDGVDSLFHEVQNLKGQLASVHTNLRNVIATHSPATSNNVTFTWTGSTQTLSWPAGSVKDAKGINIPVLAGSLTSLSASTYYWLAWNKIHQQMVSSTNADTLLENINNTVICQVFTGTTGQTGTAGGGGSQSAVDLSGARYKNF